VTPLTRQSTFRKRKGIPLFSAGRYCIDKNNNNANQVGFVQMRILVVENDKILGDAINQRIRKLGHGVDLAVTGEQAKQIALSQAYDLILLDLNLPLLNGSQALKSLREQHSNTPVLILTARDQVEDRIALLDLGADGYMTKPFDFGELEARCRALLRRSQGQEGDVDMTHNGGITEDDVEDGYILSCCSVPKGNVVVEF